MKRLLLALGFFSVVHVSHAQNSLHPMGQGLPLPWPFPWAEDCGVNWESMEGRYLLEASMAEEHLNLAITVIGERGFKLVRVTRYDRDGVMVADGVTTVAQDQKVIDLGMQPLRSDEPLTRATLKLYHSSRELRCDASSLVPILTLEKQMAAERVETHYRLVKVEK